MVLPHRNRIHIFKQAIPQKIVGHTAFIFFIVMDKNKLRNTLCWYGHTVYIYIYIYFAEMNSVIQKATNIKSHYFIVSTITFCSAVPSGLQWLLSIISWHSIWFNNIFKWLSYRGFLVLVNKFFSISLPWNLLTMHSFNTKMSAASCVRQNFVSVDWLS